MNTTQTLTDARAELAKAKAAYAVAITKRAKRDAAESIEFWGNKAAFLANANAEGWA